ncbi:ATP-binding protein [Streptomyces sp. NPDC005805]|uniref:ATP-binding protein n=1 Tax=Streptomyces sp. NPDC005805 TaxID=3157068 RepID=UPI0033CD350A
MASIENPQTVAPVAQEWSLGYSMVKGSVPLARIHARRMLTLWQWAGDVEDVVLILSELIANAVRHAGEPGILAGVRLAMLEDGTLLIDVSDPMPAFPGFGSIVAPCPTEVSGRGICLARPWGPVSAGSRTRTAAARPCAPSWPHRWWSRDPAAPSSSSQRELRGLRRQRRRLVRQDLRNLQRAG